MNLEAREGFERAPRTARRAKRMRRSVGLRLRGLARAAGARFASPLTRRIVVLNLGGLAALLIGFLYLNQSREGLIEAKVQSLQIQAEIIAAAIAASATVETDSIAIDPEKLLQLAPGESYALADETAPSLEFSINPERIGPVLHRLASPTRTRARIYDRDGYLLLDSHSLTSRSNIMRYDLPPPARQEPSSLWTRIGHGLKRLAGQSGLSLYEDLGGNGKSYPEVARALSGGAQSIVRVDVQGETIVLVAVPIQRFRAVRGALLLSTQGDDIDKIIASERWAIVRIFLVSSVIMFLLSLFIAGTIAEPIRRLAGAAERVRRGTKARREIPDFTGRSDEIGHLSGALRDMTKALYDRIEAIERFAADVAHELKNPLTSLRSAVETLPVARSPESRQRLLAIIAHDVRRLDRLISDISDASRLDAEMARDDVVLVDLTRLLVTVAAMANLVKDTGAIRVELVVAPPGPLEDGRRPAFLVLGHDSRLAQVFNNLIDNARSFSTADGSVRMLLRPTKDYTAQGHTRDGFEIIIDDDGPGIPADAFERIFERFYTDRPDQGFGQNSGLGLSISRQIIEAHGGRISALNRIGPPGADGLTPVLGARFLIFLPKAR
ncbi:MAG TPA: stimulus-sensing domain-containing protein [Methylocella sp.]